MKRLCIYLTYDKQNIVDDYIGYMLKELQTCVDSLVVVCNQTEICRGIENLELYADNIFYRENIGFDVGGFKDTICKFIGWDKIYEYEELILVNDSFFGPFIPMNEIFAEMEQKDVDFWGLTKHGARMENGFFTPEHIQSFFVAFRSKMFLGSEFHDFWENMPYYTTFMTVVEKHEMQFTRYFKEKGYTYAVYADMEPNDSIHIENNYNQYSALPYELMTKRNFPFLKKQHFSEEFLHMQTQENYIQSMEYISKETQYDISLIWKHMIRILNVSDIQKNFALLYLPEERRGNIADLKRACIIARCENEYAIESVLDELIKVQNVCMPIIVSDKEEILSKYRSLCPFQCLSRTNFADIIMEYDYCCIIHDEDISSDNRQSCKGKSAFFTRWENLVRSEEYIAAIIDIFETNDFLGYLAPPRSIHAEFFGEMADSWNGHFHTIDERLKNRGIYVPYTKDKPPFSVSDSYWIRTKSIEIYDKNIWFDSLLRYQMIYLVQAAGYYSGIVESKRYAVMNQVNQQKYLESITEKVKEWFGEFSSCREMEKLLFKVSLERFITKHSELMIYGIGGMARAYKEILPKVSGYIVSDGHPKEDTLDGVPVYYLSEVEADSKLGIIICVMKKYQAQIIPDLINKGITDYICI